MPVSDPGTVPAGGHADGSPACAAFFDVDETLLSVRTLESFLLYYRERKPGWVSTERLRRLAEEVLEDDRAVFNATYYSLWADLSVADVRRAGEEWYREMSLRDGFFRPNVREQLERLRGDGAAIVLVSGSFGPPLDPLAREIDADAVFYTRLEERDGRYTGAIASSMIGEDKRRAVAGYLARHETVSASSSWGYGDHISDLPLLETVTHPVVVGDDPHLGEVARQRGWPILATTAPLRPRG